MANYEGNKYNCPNICPTSGDQNVKGDIVDNKPNTDPKSRCTPYVPGCIQAPVPKSYPPGAPPLYLPQSYDTTSGDFLLMGSIDPWAAGHLDWTPQAGITGVRPVVDKYSITRYSTGEWRKNNEYILTPRAVDKANNFETKTKNEINDAFSKIDKNLNDSNAQLDQRIKDLKYWKAEVQKAQEAIAVEIDTLDKDRARLKGACRILMLPEAISRECLELRTQRYEPDLVRDDAEQELVREVAIVGEIRRVFMDTLAKAEHQMTMNKAAKAAIEGDWSDKMVTLNLDKRNLNLTPDSNITFFHPGVARWPENTSSLEYWKHYCAESIRNCEEVRKKSEQLRANLMTAIVKGGEDMKLQAERTNAAFAETIAATESMCENLEGNLRENLKKIAEVENLIDYLKDSLKRINDRNKLVMTRLKFRNYERPNVENCKDDAQYSLMAEAKFVKESHESFCNKLREAETIRSELIKYRGDLEKDIACKRKSLSIDKDRCSRVRAHMPTPEEFAAAGMVAGVAVYPAGWGEPAVQETCGPTADQYNIGRCHLRWAYLLAVIACLDGIVLSALAFILATRHVKLQPDTAYPPPSLYKGEVNNAYVTDAQSVAGSRKSLALQPVLLVRPPADLDTYSHYSHPSHHSHHSSRTPRPKHGIYANAMHNYQL